ncbi:MAG: HDIG domain-containing protein [Candidatus Kapabacteria bacterium]|nr:HDIG domain-containing protein [Ignavibacteriota bacterium]MCW5886265.1 HDIG domain-containing protein [Candidatus Kapabacteria bacterium]
MSKLKETLFSKLSKKKIAENYIDKISYPSTLTSKILILLISVLLTGIFFVLNIDKKPYDTPDYRIVPGNVWEGAPLVADFSFPVYKPQNEYLEQRKKAAESALTVFILDESIEESMLNKLDNYLLVLNEIENNPQDSPEFSFPERIVKPLLSLNKNQKDAEIKKIEKVVSQYLKKSFQSGFINITVDKMNAKEISVKTSAHEFTILPVSNLTDKNLFLINAEKIIETGVSQSLRPLVLEILSRLNTHNLIFSKELTDKSIELAMTSVPRTSGYVKKGEIIIQNGEKLTTENIQKISSYQSSVFMTGDAQVDILYYLGGIGHGAILCSILILYILIIRRKIFDDNTQLIILMMVLVATSALAWLSNQIHTQYPLELLISIPALSMLVAIVYDSRTAFYATVTMSLLLAGIRGNDYVTGTIMIFTGIIAAYTVRDIQSRTQMYLSFFYIFLGFLVTLLVFGAERTMKLEEILTGVVFGFINSIMAPLITFGLLFVIERFSNISTDLRIKEFDNLDHPLLRMLSEKAPGTYQHTLSVAILAERCSREIGANPLLTKVGTYFHDIGKMAKSEYFTENQIGMDNKHDIMNAKKSAKIIIEHVNEGIKLAQEFHLPQRLIDFIPMHHGTTLVKHFYAKALEIAEDSFEVNENDFRYPGPKPQSKETAILMICDFAEAISRLDSKSLDEIESIIEKNIHERVTDGQFDECEITLDDLTKIRRVIAKNLIGMTHKRVNYKEIPKK